MKITVVFHDEVETEGFSDESMDEQVKLLAIELRDELGVIEMRLARGDVLLVPSREVTAIRLSEEVDDGEG